ncbi:putative E3 Ubiquitin-Protein Ligase Herc6 [Manis pentadactyla]|nr:putative E3 Ubiquitin-Protein Ligase Herc6 [Manis pentadactyla]
MICGCSSQTYFCWNISQLCDNLSAGTICSELFLSFSTPRNTISFPSAPRMSWMHDSRNWRSPVLPFTEAICKMSHQSSRVLNGISVPVDQSNK